MPQSKTLGEESAVRRMYEKRGDTDAYLDQFEDNGLHGGHEKKSLDGAWTNTTVATPDTIDRKNRQDR